MKVAQTGESAYTYTFSEMGSNMLQVNISDTAGYTVASETTTVNFGIDLLHIGVVVAIFVVALYLAIFRLRKDRDSKTSQEKQEPTLAQPQAPPTAPPEKQELPLAQLRAPPTLTATTSPATEDPVAILKLRYAKGEITKEQYEEILKTLRE